MCITVLHIFCINGIEDLAYLRYILSQLDLTIFLLKDTEFGFGLIKLGFLLELIDSLK